MVRRARHLDDLQGPCARQHAVADLRGLQHGLACAELERSALVLVDDPPALDVRIVAQLRGMIDAERLRAKVGADGDLVELPAVVVVGERRDEREPLQLLALVAAVVLVLWLSGLAGKKDFESIKRTLIFALENIFFVMAPTMVSIIAR